MSPLLITSDVGIHGFPVPLETRDHEANIKDDSPGLSVLSKSGDPRIDHFFPLLRFFQSMFGPELKPGCFPYCWLPYLFQGGYPLPGWSV